MRQGFLKGSLHLFGSRLRGDLRGHVVQVLPKILDIPAALMFKSTRHDLSKVTLDRHTSGARLRLKCGGILLRQVNCQVHTLLLQVNPAPCMPGMRLCHRQSWRVEHSDEQQPPFCLVDRSPLE
jgi:hypothetical protein